MKARSVVSLDTSIGKDENVALVLASMVLKWIMGVSVQAIPVHITGHQQIIEKALCNMVSYVYESIRHF